MLYLYNIEGQHACSPSETMSSVWETTRTHRQRLLKKWHVREL